MNKWKAGKICIRKNGYLNQELSYNY